MMAETLTIPAYCTPAALLVIADDFTGANDTGVALVRQGLTAHVQFDIQTEVQRGSSASAVIYSSDSRALSAAQAAQKVTLAVQAGMTAISGQHWVFKKIDSTLRGNLGAETEAALTALNCPLAIVAPAVPALGRVVADGKCYVNGQLLTETEFASDPKTPVHTASIAERLAEQTSLKQHHVSLEALRSGDLHNVIFALVASGVRILIADSETPEDLKLIVQTAESLPFRPLMVGASGLIHALTDAALHDNEHPPVISGKKLPLLAVVGSMSEIALQQVACVMQHRAISLLDIDVMPLFSDEFIDIQQTLVAQISQALAQGKHCVIRTSQGAEQRHRIAQFCQQHDISRSQMGERIAAFLGQLIRHLLQQTHPGGIYLTGGDIALAVVRALGAKGFEIKGQIAGCVPWGYLQGSQIHRLPVMTKAGGFGTESTLLEVLRFIEEKLSD
ncbi:four-carbon acid sugar kinase family protein [Rahnella sp. CFA14(1/10)]|uniref:D-threonate kinase n=1 Tax=Rahnella sp. CFA14(1/10) TaxID=2511203 RepID=UPI001F0E57B7|nr:four-carbon acid sugar kinase family protein [Rahnella sp. CFA14(1/10)]